MKANVRKYMSVLIVNGTHRRHFFAKKRPFEVYFYFTPVKRVVIDYKCDGIALKDLGFTQIIGHGIEEVQAILNDKGCSFFSIER